MKMQITILFILIIQIVACCQDKTTASDQADIPYTIKEWNPNWTVELPDTLRTDTISGVIWLNLKFDKKALTIEDVSIPYLMLKERKSGTIIYESTIDTLNNKIDDSLYDLIEKYKIHFMDIGSELTIQKNFEGNSDSIYKNEVITKLKF